MKLRHDWYDIVKRAWSVRLMLLAGLLTGLEVALPYLDWLPIPTGVAALASVGVTGAAFVARIVAQKNLIGKVIE